MRNKSFSRFLKPSQLNYQFVERFFVLLLSLTLILLNFNFSEEQKNIRSRVIDFFSPLNKLFMIPSEAVTQFKNTIENYINLNERYLEQQVDLKQQQKLLNELYQLRVENEELKKLLNFEAPSAVNKIVSRIIVDPSDIHSSKVFIDVGSNREIKLNSPVFNENGLLGRIIDVQAKTSEVLLIVDPRSSLPVMTNESKIKFFVEGNLKNLNIKYMPENKIIFENELVISTDVSGYFRQGIIVGKIIKNKEGEMVIQPSANKTDSVYVMTVVSKTNNLNILGVKKND